MTDLDFLVERLKTEMKQMYILPKCSRCRDTGIDQTEVAEEGRLMGVACDRCEIGEQMAAKYQAEAE